jgi:hypothetical protein
MSDQLPEPLDYATPSTEKMSGRAKLGCVLFLLMPIIIYFLYIAWALHDLFNFHPGL